MLQELMTAKEIKALQTDQTREGDQLKRLLKAANINPTADAKAQFISILGRWRAVTKKATEEAAKS